MSALRVSTNPLNTLNNKRPAIANPHAVLNLKGGKEKLPELHNIVKECVKTGDRKNAVRAFKECTYLINIPLEHVHLDDNWTKEKCVAMEAKVCQDGSITMNGVSIGKGSSLCRSPTELQRIVAGVCGRMSSGNSNNKKHLYQAILTRLVEPEEENNSAFVPKALWQTVACGGLHLQKLDADKDVEIEIYNAAGCVHAVFKQRFTYALFHPTYQTDRPWIKFTTTVHERANLTTQSSVRRLAIAWPKK